jgi:hypothetical protein
VKVRIDPLAIRTFQRLAGVRAFIDLLDGSIPEAEWREREALQQLAREQDLDFGDFDVRDRVIDEHFGYWMPRLSAYSAVILLDSVVEAQLFACAERVSRRTKVELGVRRGQGIAESAARFIREASGVNVTADPAWPGLRDLHELRNIIVHRWGTRGDSPQHQGVFDRLVRTYAPGLSSADQPSWLYGELWVSLRLCSQVAKEVEGFFSRLLKAIERPAGETSA